MSIMIGGAEPSAIKIGSADASAVYAGDTKVWPTDLPTNVAAGGWIAYSGGMGGQTVYSFTSTGVDIQNASNVKYVNFHLPIGSNNVTAPYDFYYEVEFSALPRGANAALFMQCHACADSAPETFNPNEIPSSSAPSTTGTRAFLSVSADSPGGSYYRNENDQWQYTDALINGGVWKGRFRDTRGGWNNESNGYGRLAFHFDVRRHRNVLKRFDVKVVQSTRQAGDDELAIEIERFQREHEENVRQYEEMIRNG